MAYSALFNDHIANPRGGGEVEDADAVGEETNPVCGDRLRISLKVSADIIKEARFLAYGCAPTLACGSALTELLEGIPIERASRLDKQDITRKLGGLPARKGHAAALAIETLRVALKNLRVRVIERES